MHVFLTGATGFVGGHVLRQLVNEGHAVRALVRDVNKADLPRNSQVQLIHGDIVDGTGLDEGMKGCNAVIHLVGIIAETGKATFERVHHQGTGNVVEAAKHNKIARFVHMSALGARGNGVSAYQTSKWKAEESVRASGMAFCILQPSLIIGAGSGFVGQMLDIMRKALLFRPVPGDGKPRFRPVFVRDVAACFVQALVNPAATNKTIEIGGGEELSLNQILAEIARCSGVRKPPIHIPLPLMFVGAAMAQALLPRPPVTVGQLRMLNEGATCDISLMTQIFGIQPVGFRAGVSDCFSV
jgi:NADH dehydrogenase